MCSASRFVAWLLIVPCLKKHGAMVADNGNFFSLSVAPDQRWPSGAFSHFSSVSVTNFEVIQTTGATEGPRSPGAPRVDAGADQTVLFGDPISLPAQLIYTNTPAPVLAWRL